MKRTLLYQMLIFVFMSLISLMIKAQGVSVSFSIEWEQIKYFAPIANNNDTIPILLVEYQNFTDTAFYMQRLGNTSGCEFPRMPADGLYSYLNGDDRPNLYELAINSKGKQDQGEFIVDITTVFCAKRKSLQESLSNDYISFVYDFLRSIIRCGLLFDDSIDWTDGDLSLEAVIFYEKHKHDEFFDIILKYGVDTTMLLKKYKENLVFLPPHSKEVRQYNLIGFWYVGGNYLFKLPDNYQSLQKVNMKASTKTIPLPSSIDDFVLYKGNFISNEVMLKEVPIR